MHVKQLTKDRGQTEDGFTLIEVLIAVAILGIGILGMASMQVSAIRGNSSAGKMTSNATWAMDRIELLLALPYDHTDLDGNKYDSEITTDPIEQGLDHVPDLANDGVDNDLNGQVDEDGESGPVTIQWKVVENYPIQKTKAVRITVGQGIGSGRKTVSIMCYKMDNV